MSTKLSVDYRENSLIQLLNNSKVDFTINNLPVGDFIIYKNDVVKLIIERKSFLDLSASITDGRFREQKSRLLDSGSKILYIIEGVKNSIPTKLKCACNGAIQNLIYKHNIDVIYTYDPSDTLDNILMLLKKIENDDILSSSDSTVNTQVKLFSKSDKINSNIFSLQLSVIPGVSLNISNKISDKFNNMKNLITHLIEHGQDSLSDIHLTDKRKLGKALSKKIYTSLLI